MNVDKLIVSNPRKWKMLQFLVTFLGFDTMNLSILMIIINPDEVIQRND